MGDSCVHIRILVVHMKLRATRGKGVVALAKKASKDSNRPKAAPTITFNAQEFLVAHDREASPGVAQLLAEVSARGITNRRLCAGRW
jgi:hypothetical protein